jgi:hypothetical protein
VTPTSHGSGFYWIAIRGAILFAGSGLLFLCLALLDVAGDLFLYASTLCSVLAVLTGFGGIVTLVAGWVKKRHEIKARRLLGLAIAFAACCPQFFLGGISYDLGHQKLLSDLCACGLCVSLILLVMTLLLTWVSKLHFDKPN